jgi:P-type Cu2+ transporter
MRSTNLEREHAEHTMGMSPGMPPKSASAHMGHDRHAGHSVAMFRDKFWLTLILTLPVVAWSGEVQHWLGYTAPTFPGSQYISAFLGAVVFLYGGSVFLRGAWGELAGRRPGMMTLISLGIVVAFAASLAATFGLFQIDVWWEVATLITIMLLGHWLEMKAIAQARGALDALAALLPDSAERITDSGAEKVPLAELRVGDVVLVRRGARVPADGKVIDPRDVVGAIELSRAAYRKMVQNLVWATAYNLIAIPVAAGLFVRWRIDLPMSVGAIAMSASTMIVASNAQLLRRLRIVH